MVGNAKARLCPRLFLFFALLLLGCRQQQSAENPYAYKFKDHPGPSVVDEIEFLEQRVRERPQAYLEKANLAGSYLTRARTENSPEFYHRAEEMARQSLEQFKNSPAQLVLAQVAEAEHRFAEVKEICLQVLEQEPANTEAKALLVTAYLELGEIEAASKLAGELGRLPTPATLVLRARCAEAVGQDEPAIEFYEHAMRIEQPGESARAAQVRLALARLHRKRGRVEIARRLLEAASVAAPREGAVLLEWAELEAEAGDLERAADLDVRAFALMQEGGPLVHLGEVRRRLGQEKESREAFQQAELLLTEEREQGHFGHGRDLGRLYLLTGRPQEALEVMQQELEFRRDPTTVLVAAEAYLEAGRPQRGRELLEELTKSGFQAPEVSRLRARFQDPSAEK